MIGVVLWSEQALNKAVIWCDDQGDLAFYSDKTGAGFQDLNPGDWVEFELTLGGNFRIAKNLRVLMEKGSPDLAARLTAAQDHAEQDCTQHADGAVTAAPCAGVSRKSKGSEKVVPFPQSSPRRSKSTAKTAVVKLKRR